jgi:hypothetical protein
MSGTIVLPDGRLWSASSGVYHRVVDHLAAAVTDREPAAELREMARGRAGQDSAGFVHAT